MTKKLKKRKPRPYGLYVRISPSLNRELMKLAIAYTTTKQALISGLLTSFVRHNK